MAIITGGHIIEGAYGDYLFAGAPTSGTSGTFAGVAPIGAELTDTVNGIIYVNTGTQLSPAWTKVGTQV